MAPSAAAAAHRGRTTWSAVLKINLILTSHSMGCPAGMRMSPLSGSRSSSQVKWHCALAAAPGRRCAWNSRPNDSVGTTLPFDLEAGAGSYEQLVLVRALFDLFDELRHDFEQVPDDAEVG